MSIKSMKLYTNVERIYNELNELGLANSELLSVEDLSQFDQLHYHGIEALDVAIKILGVNFDDDVLEIGSGIGGPARYLTSKTGASISALELQPDQNELAQTLSQKCGIENNLHHICGDFLEYDWNEKQFDVIVSWLALYHIPDRPKMLSRCHKLLKEGAQFYTEDLYMREAFTDDESDELERELYAITLPNSSSYTDELKAAGFKINYCEDMTASWSAFTHERLKAYRKDRDRHVRVHGETTVDALDVFYATVDKYFQSGKLGGIRLCAQRL